MHRNPIRYRGYYYDAETGFYYLQSRYYDPMNRRFINADCYTSTSQGFLGCNMFAYCNNNPINQADPSGYASWGTNTVAICDGYGGGYASIGGTSDSGSGIIIPPIPGFLDPIDEWIESKTEELWDAISKSFARAIPRKYVSPQEEHHIVAKKAFNAQRAAEILWNVFPNDGVENPLNKVFIKTGLHRRIHRNLYYAITNQVIIDAYNAADGDEEKQIGNVTIALTTMRGIILVLNARSPY